MARSPRASVPDRPAREARRQRKKGCTRCGDQHCHAVPTLEATRSPSRPHRRYEVELTRCAARLCAMWDASAVARPRWPLSGLAAYTGGNGIVRAQGGNPMKLFAFALGLASLTACMVGSDALTYEEFKQHAVLEPDTGIYTMNGDEMIESEEAMFA